MNPWEHYNTTEIHEEINPGCGHYSMTYGTSPTLKPTRYTAYFTTIPDNKQLWWRKGDVIQFNSGFYGYCENDWKDSRKGDWRKGILAGWIRERTLVGNH